MSIRNLAQVGRLGLWKHSDTVKTTHQNISSLLAETSNMLGLLPWNFTKSFFPETDAMLQRADKPFVQSEVEHFNYINESEPSAYTL